MILTNNAFLLDEGKSRTFSAAIPGKTLDNAYALLGKPIKVEQKYDIKSNPWNIKDKIYRYNGFYFESCNDQTVQILYVTEASINVKGIHVDGTGKDVLKAFGDTSARSSGMYFLSDNQPINASIYSYHFNGYQVDLISEVAQAQSFGTVKRISFSFSILK